MTVPRLRWKFASGLNHGYSLVSSSQTLKVEESQESVVNSGQYSKWINKRKDKDC